MHILVRVLLPSLLADRTNVVQSTLARWTLTEQLRSVGVLSKDERIDDKADFMHMFRNGKCPLHRCF